MAAAGMITRGVKQAAGNAKMVTSSKVAKGVQPPGASLKPSYRTVLALLRRPARAERWRSWVASCAAAALILPSVALLPAASDFGSEAAHVHPGAEHPGGDSDHAALDSRARLADIPGSSTHPVNHDCTTCQVIKYLATSFLPQADVAVVALEFNDAPPSTGRHRPPAILRVAVTPPIRAPPYLRA